MTDEEWIEHETNRTIKIIETQEHRKISKKEKNKIHAFYMEAVNFGYDEYADIKDSLEEI